MMMSYGHFRYGTMEELDQLVQFDKADHPQKIPYAIGFSLKHPGWFTLSYVFRKSVLHEFVGIRPTGYT